MVYDPNGILANISNRETELLEALRQLREEKQQITVELQKKEKEESLKQFKIKIIGIAGDYFEVASAWNNDFVELLRLVPGRWYQSYSKTNKIPINGYENFLKLMQEKMPTVAIEYVDDVKDQIENIINQPAWTISLQERNFKLQHGRGYSYSDLSNVPGFESVDGKDNRVLYFKVPLSEGWRLHKHMERIGEYKKVVWEDDALAFVIKQIEQRKSIDEIAIAKDWPFDVTFADPSVTLRPVQRVTSAFIEATGHRTLVALQMGLGKTIIAIGDVIKNNFKALVICPASLKNNWCREIYRLTGTKPQVLIGTEPSAYDIHQLMNAKAQFTVTNFDTISRPSEYDKEWIDEDGRKRQSHEKRFFWADVLNLANFDIVIVDESHYIKNTDSNRSQAVRALKPQRILHMTGTPVLNRPGELWPMLNMIAPETFPSEETFIRQYTYDRKTARNVEELKEVLKPIMIRRKQSDVVDELPPLNRIEEYHELSKKALKLYKKVLDGIYEELAEFDARRRNYDAPNEMSVASVLAKIMRLKQICAIDKVERTADLATEIHESASEDKHNKVLIFSQFKAVAYAIHQRLGHESLCFVDKGRNDFETADVNERDRIVQQFQHDDKYKYLVVTEKSAKEGHNITEAGHVIFNDLFWTPASHDQGEGRAYMRINDPHGIDSYYLITDMGGDGIEEWIWELLGMKTAVINQTVEGVEASRDVSVAMALISKLKESMYTRKR